MIYIGILLLFIYTATLTWLRLGNWRLLHFYSDNRDHSTKFSIIVPFRNEEENLPELLRSIVNLEYYPDMFELLLIDDASTDDSVKLIKEALSNTKIDWRIINNERNSNSPKKDAISLGVRRSNYKWIVTTDADCEVPVRWLAIFDQVIREKKPKMICGQVFIDGNDNFLKEYQKFEMLALQGVTKGGFGWNRPLLCNGANLSYLKDAFEQVKGFQGNDNLASGDDLFLMQKFSDAYPGQTVFLKNNMHTVITEAVNGFGKMVAQRIRWAAKTSKLKSPILKSVALIVFTMNLWLVIATFYFPIFSWEYLLWFLIVFLFKIVMDCGFIEFTGASVRIKVSYEYLIITNLFYPYITTYTSIRSLFGGYRWKGRDFKR